MGWDKQVGSRFSPHLGVGCGVSASVCAEVGLETRTGVVKQQLSFSGDLPNTVFTNDAGKESKTFLRYSGLVLAVLAC